ncbi:hypothetical protein OIU74_002740 [Salix koriyanagi]|uniref:Chlororespiratory reduction 4 n=1 Tax=Salix koriyanagi TaxID=2511006 RepID=A0A9Q1APK8_9ROSI|nr:hypothetical protein OIU74_002740 [Salix koriyanagi]
MPQRDLFSWTLMITCYTRNGEVDKARELFGSLPCRYRKGVACWNAMISGYVKKGRVDEAKRLFDEMPVKNIISWNSMLAGYTQNRNMRLGLEFFNEMGERDVVSWNLMVDGFVQVGDLDSAWKFFQEIPKPNVVSWVTMLSGNIGAQTAMISGYIQCNKVDEARKLFDEISTWDVVCWNAMIAGYAHHGRINEALCLSKQMVNKDTVTWNTIISCYAQVGQMDRAVKIFEEMEEKDLVSWNSLIAGFMLNGQNLDALKSFALMGPEGEKPDQLSFACGLSSCATVAALQVGKQLHQVVVKSEYAIEPLAEHYACMVDLLGRVGRLDEAFEMVRGMKVKANAGVWGALLGACRAHGNLELGRLAAHKLSEFEPHKTSNYVLLSNIHAEANRWNEAQEVRMLMNAGSAVKEPGCSWVEVRNQVHGFLSDDSTQSRLDINVTLASLTSHIRNAFHISEVTA